MSSVPTHSGGSPAALEDDRWALVSRVLSSRQFSKAPQMRDILTYLCQRALEDPAAVIREQEIGCKVLGRKSDFNPNEDNIVRVQIGHVRKRLDEFFSSESGKDEPIQITIPRGSYVPRFEARPQPALESPPVVDPAPPERRTRSRPNPILAATTVLLALLCIALAVRPMVSARLRPATNGATPVDPFWARLFGGNQAAAIVVADTCLVLMQDLLHTDVTVPEYANRHYTRDWVRQTQGSELQSAVLLLADRQYTSLADLNLSAKMTDLSRRFGPAPAKIRYARDMTVRDFKTGNLVLIGSRRGIPWVSLFDHQLNFAMEEDPKTHRFAFRNRSPRPGEQGLYSPAQNNGSADSYADVALLPNLENNGSVLILSGLTMVDTEATGELLTRNESWQWLSQKLGTATVRDRYFEILLKIREVAGAAESSEIVAYRVLPQSATVR